MNLRILFLLAFVLSGSLAQAEPKGPAAEAIRALASVSKIDWSLKAPSVQRVEGREAQDFYKALAGGKNFDELEKKNLEEFRLLGESLEARGYTALEKPLKGNVFTSAQALVFYRQADQNVSAMNGELAHTGMALEFYYYQVFLKKGERLTPSTVVPQTVLHGMVFLQCPPKSKDSCPISAITVTYAAIRWDLLPSNRMGGNSSAGGAGQN